MKIAGSLRKKPSALIHEHHSDFCQNVILIRNVLRKVIFYESGEE